MAHFTSQITSRITRNILEAVSISRLLPGYARALQLQRIQASMLGALHRSQAENTSIRAKILAANDLDQLWYLRCDLMQVISAGRSEKQARALLAPVTALFDEIVPSSMHSRSSPEQRRQHINETAQGIDG